MIVDLASSRGELVVDVDGLEGLRAGDELTAVQLAQDSLGGNTPGQVKDDPHERCEGDTEAGDDDTVAVRMTL